MQLSNHFFLLLNAIAEQQLQQQIEEWQALLEKLGGIDGEGVANAEIAKYQTNL